MSYGGSYGGEYGGPSVPPLAPSPSTRYGNTPSGNALTNVINVYRLLPLPLDDDGGTANAWTLIYANLPCSVQARDADREERQARVSQVTEYRFLIGTNPGVMEGDLIRWTDDLGVLRQISVIGLENLAGRGTAFYVYGEEVT